MARRVYEWGPVYKGVQKYGLGDLGLTGRYSLDVAQ